MLKGRLIFKYIVIVGTVICAGLAIAHFVKIELKLAAPSDLVVTPDLGYNASLPLSIKDKDSLLNDRYLRCFLQPSKPFCKLAADKRLELFSSDSPDEWPDIEIVENRFENLTATLQRAENSVYQLMADLTRLLQPFRVEAFVIEPSILFCLLPSSVKLDLQLSGVNPSRVLGSRNVVTFGIFEEDSKVLNEVNATNALLSAGFKIMKVHKWNSSEGFEPVHYLFIRGQVAAHVVVFFKRRSYLWHAGLDARKIDFDGLLFVREGTYERFRLRSLLGPQRDDASVNQFFVPSNVKYFLAETLTFAFRGCPGSSPSLPLGQQDRADQQDDVRVALALREMKTILAPVMIPFWLCMNSSRGWFDHCNALYEESTLELCLKLRSSQMSFLLEEVSKSDVLKIRADSSDSNDGILLDALGLHVNIYCLFQGDDSEFGQIKYLGKNESKPRDESWQFCSTDVLGQKVNVPCWETYNRTPE